MKVEFNVFKKRSNGKLYASVTNEKSNDLELIEKVTAIVTENNGSKNPDVILMNTSIKQEEVKEFVKNYAIFTAKNHPNFEA